MTIVIFPSHFRQLQDEFDFTAEANGMDRIADALERGGRRPVVLVPRSIPGLTSKRVTWHHVASVSGFSEKVRENMEKPTTFDGLEPKLNFHVNMAALGHTTFSDTPK
jgi:hypothetical protein